MKILQVTVLTIFCAALLFFGFSTISKSNKKQDNSVSFNSSQILSSLESTDTESDSTNSTAEEIQSSIASETESEGEKSSLIQGVDSDISLLDPSAVSWGPGYSVNSENQSTACVALQEKYSKLGSVFIMDTDKVYLTFDLGYEAGYTNNILDALKANNVKAVFFLVGSYAKNNPDIVNRIISEGHTVGNHGTTHKNMTTLSDSDAQQEILGMQKIMQDNYSYTPYLFRFPEGAFSERALGIANSLGYHSVFWSFAYNDWDNAKQPQYSEALEKAVSRLHKGAVYLLHPMKTNSEMLDEFIKTAKNNNFEFGVI